ncbi:MAG: ribosome-binding factor A [Magnetococcales bacterium]|nr:ribosome-binding factor A [Magnetococcales bacterium]
MSHVAAQHTGSGGRIRTERVRGIIREEIAGMLLRQEIHDPRLSGFISITDVRLSADMNYATVYFSVVEESGPALSPPPVVAAEEGHQGPAEAEGGRSRACQQALAHAAGFIRSQLGRRIQLRHTPHLRFLPDHSLDYGMRMDRLLGSLQIPPAETEAEAETAAHSSPAEDR